MTRDEAQEKVEEWMLDTKVNGIEKMLYTDGQFTHYGKVELRRDIDRIYDSLENEANKKDK